MTATPSSDQLRCVSSEYCELSLCKWPTQLCDAKSMLRMQAHCNALRKPLQIIVLVQGTRSAMQQSRQAPQPPLQPLMIGRAFLHPIPLAVTTRHMTPAMPLGHRGRMPTARARLTMQQAPAMALPARPVLSLQPERVNQGKLTPTYPHGPMPVMLMFDSSVFCCMRGKIGGAQCR